MSERAGYVPDNATDTVNDCDDNKGGDTADDDEEHSMPPTVGTLVMPWLKQMFSRPTISVSK
jgi:hypothetical protein